MTARVTLDTRIEELVQAYPASVGFLTRKGIRCIRCGEPLWCTLGELLTEEGVENPQHLVHELNMFLMKKS